MGRSRGGLSTKIHTLTDQSTCPVQVRLTGGQAGDNPQLVALLDDYARAGAGGRFRLLADKAYSHPSTRKCCAGAGSGTPSCEKSDQIARRKAKGRAGGRPPAFDASAYKKRNVVERGYLHLKQWCGIATRYDKHERTFLGGVQLASTILHLKHHLGDTL